MGEDRAHRLRGAVIDSADDDVIRKLLGQA